MSVIRFSHVGVCVSDLERSLRFYRDGLGFREMSRLEASGAPASTLLELDEAKVQAVFLERDGIRLELLHYSTPGHRGDPRPRPMNELGLTHVSVRVDDLDSTLAQVERVGGNVLAASRIEIPRVRTSAVFVTDPDGTRVELVQAPGDPSAPPR